MHGVGDCRDGPRGILYLYAAEMLPQPISAAADPSFGSKFVSKSRSVASEPEMGPAVSKRGAVVEVPDPLDDNSARRKFRRDYYVHAGIDVGR